MILSWLIVAAAGGGGFAAGYLLRDFFATAPVLVDPSRPRTLDLTTGAARGELEHLRKPEPARHGRSTW